MTKRSIHLVGSLPGDDAEDVMHLALRRNGKYLHTLPAEPGGDWIIPIIKKLREHPGMSVRTEGDWSSYTNILLLRMRRGATLKADSVDFGRVALFEEIYPLFKKLREEYNYPDLAYQVGIAGDLDMVLQSMGLRGALAHRRVFAEVTTREMKEIQAKVVDDDVVFQLELPIELVLVSRVPGFAQTPLSRFLAGGVLRLVAEAPAGTRFGVHLCLGDLHNQALGRLQTTAPVVTLANEIMSKWPADRRLEYIHVPLAAGKNPPPLDERFYRDLGKLTLPHGVRFVAGLVHEKATLDEQRQVVRWVERYIGYPVDVAAACGLGRRERSVAEAILERSRELAEG